MLLTALEKTPSERAAKARELIDEAVRQGEKTLLFCEHNITDLLEKEFQMELVQNLSFCQFIGFECFH